MRRPILHALAAVAGVAVLASGCVSDATTNPLSDATFGSDDGLGGDLDGRIEPDTGLGGDTPSPQVVVEAALSDVEAFWERRYPEVYGGPYEPIQGGYWPYGPRTELPPCGDPSPRYEEIAANAFYCPEADLVAWDEANLVQPLYEEYGGFTIGMIMAHELAHAVQVRAGVEGDTIMTELQADCFAGAWTADVAEGGSRSFAVRVEDLDLAMAGLLQLRDGVGTDARHPLAHGTGFDRVGAFSEGLTSGLDRCVAYPDLYDSGELVIVEVPFTSLEDFQRGGNLPLDQIFPLAVDDLEHFWTVRFGGLGRQWAPVEATQPVDPDRDQIACGDETFAGDELENASFYCPANDTIVLSTARITALNEIGDYAVAADLAHQYARAAQARLGTLDESADRTLQADCFAGVYADSGFRGDRGDDQILFLSPGDLDEAVLALLHTAEGAAFERFDAYRAGFVEGFTACDEIVDRQ